MQPEKRGGLVQRRRTETWRRHHDTGPGRPPRTETRGRIADLLRPRRSTEPDARSGPSAFFRIRAVVPEDMAHHDVGRLVRSASCRSLALLASAHRRRRCPDAIYQDVRGRCSEQGREELRPTRGARRIHSTKSKAQEPPSLCSSRPKERRHDTASSTQRKRRDFVFLGRIHHRPRRPQPTRHPTADYRDSCDQLSDDVKAAVGTVARWRLRSRFMK